MKTGWCARCLTAILVVKAVTVERILTAIDYKLTVEANMPRVFLMCLLYQHYRWRYYFQREKGVAWNLLTGLTPPHICVPVSSQDLKFKRHMSYFFCCVQLVIVLFVDIGGIIDHHFFSFHYR